MKFLETAWIALLLLNAVSGKSLTDKAEDSSKGGHQCEYQGKTYSEGEDLPTRRLCLACKCTPDFVEPNDRICAIMDCPVDNRIELGCIPVYNDTECCPVSYNCEKSGVSSKCDKRYFKHYEVKNCTPVYEEGNECPKKFDCPKEIKVDDKACQFHGRLYQIGESIDTGNPCQICSCQRGWEGIEIGCISVECPMDFGPPLNDSCREVYEPGKCCADRIACDTEEDNQKPVKTCEYGGKTYHLGEKIYPDEDPCLICRCTEDWTGIHGNSCKIHDCALERKRKKLAQGCLPIYHEATCCPIEFFCGLPEEGLLNQSAPLLSAQDLESGNFCEFKGNRYKVGDVLNYEHPTNCVTCTCLTPPDFTCVHRKCPRPPNDDYENCTPTYIPGECCPTYDCGHSITARAPVPHCSPVQCPKGCSEVTIHNSCPFCQCQEKLCAPPKCAPGCTLETKEGQCPECKCQEKLCSPPKCAPECTLEIQEGQCLECKCPEAQISCSPVKCPAHCHEVFSPLGCPMCMCGSLCTPPKCEPGCHIQREVAEGECPRCVCDSNQEGASTMQCAPVKCPATCRESLSESGCPSCVCDSLCSPPKCDPGCKVDTSPQPLGSCPGCVCENQEPPKVQCAPVKCGPLCHVAYEANGCPSCLCDPLCTPPVCKEGCRLDYDPAQGPCPTCVCNGTTSKCPRVQCGGNCQQTTGADGCPTCSCGPLCSTPKCDIGCHLEYDRAAGPCPSCVCLDAVIADPFGIQCSMPKCDEDCTIDYNARPCPSCTCG
ncbi:hypothetical protein AVEN_156109-1, partial [Araneus ventricosus]